MWLTGNGDPRNEELGFMVSLGLSCTDHPLTERTVIGANLNWTARRRHSRTSGSVRLHLRGPGEEIAADFEQRAVAQDGWIASSSCTVEGPMRKYTVHAWTSGDRVTTASAQAIP